MRQFEHTSLAQAQRLSEVPGRRPLFKSIITFQNYPVDESISKRNGNPGIGNVRNLTRTTYPITLIIGTTPQLSLRLIYDSGLFEPVAIGR